MTDSCNFIVTTVKLYNPLVGVTVKARMAAGTRDATLMVIDAGLWMKCGKR